MEQHEEWRPIPRFPGYQASSLGRIGSNRQGATRILRPSADRYGYLRVTLRIPGGRTSRRVHQCVAEAFVGPRPCGQEVRHLDGNQLNNCASNLGYGTRRDNVRDALSHGTFIAGRPAKTHCPRGHEYTGPNTYIDRRGSRSCRTCKRALNRSYELAKRAYR